MSLAGGTVMPLGRRKVPASVTQWHPILAAVEGPTGTWRMIVPHGYEYGRVEIRRVPPEDRVVYKAVQGGELIGWSDTLRLACFRVHMAFLSSLRPGGGPAADWGELTGNARRLDS